MSNNIMADIAALLESKGAGKRMADLFTPADQGAFENRPLSVIIGNPQSSGEPEVTEEVDYHSVKIAVAGAYGREGEERTADKAYTVYRALLLVLDETVNDTLYLSIRAVSSPSHAGFDEHGRTVMEFDVNVMRYRGG
ncbi:MAG: hypothetical protein FWD92_03450 [Methanomassiliicoccaceae archaeon]|nr:hypothetical protein [Methanomassiliicoccaceae archaeon]